MEKSYRTLLISRSLIFTKFSDKFLLLRLISSKKFHARTKSTFFLFFITDLSLIGIFTPGINLSCLNLLSSTIKSISFDIPKKFKEVVAFAGAP